MILLKLFSKQKSVLLWDLLRRMIHVSVDRSWLYYHLLMQQSFFKSKFNNKEVLPSFWRHVTTNHKILTWWQLIMWDLVNPPTNNPSWRGKMSSPQLIANGWRLVAVAGKMIANIPVMQAYRLVSDILSTTCCYEKCLFPNQFSAAPSLQPISPSEDQKPPRNTANQCNIM